MNTPIDSTAAPLDHHALRHLGAGADEAVVLDDDRVGLQRLQHAADADAAGDVGPLPTKHHISGGAGIGGVLEPLQAAR